MYAELSKKTLNLRSCSVGITEGTDLLLTWFRLPQVA
jgi:hypothetical protein